jgi:hypothetical protein
MDVPLTPGLIIRGQGFGATLVALAVMLVIAPVLAAKMAADAPLDVAVKAAFLFNFAKFADWPALPAGTHILFCVVGDEAVPTALAATVRGHNIGGHGLDVSRPEDTAGWRTCHLFFIADTEIQRGAVGLIALKALPVLTVSDGKGFSQTGGIIELYVDGGRMRFVINVDAVEQAGLRLSSRLLGLAKVIRNVGGPQ